MLQRLGVFVAASTGCGYSNRTVALRCFRQRNRCSFESDKEGLNVIFTWFINRIFFSQRTIFFLTIAITYQPNRAKGRLILRLWRQKSELIPVPAKKIMPIKKTHTRRRVQMGAHTRAQAGKRYPRVARARQGFNRFFK